MFAGACYKTRRSGRVAELADAPDSKSGILWMCRFESDLGYQELRTAWRTGARRYDLPGVSGSVDLGDRVSISDRPTRPGSSTT